MAYVQKNNPFKLITRGRKKHARSIRKGVSNIDKQGKTETHKMGYGSGEVDGKTVYMAYPTITFDDKGKKKDQSFQEAKKAGADHVGLDDYIKKIEGGWTDIDVIITMPSLMAKVGKLGKVLGPRGLMPNPKSGTVTDDIGKAVVDVKKGKIDFKVDKTGIIHASVGKVSFDSKKLHENAMELLNTVKKLKPSSSKGIYFKSVSLSSTMSSSIKVDSSILMS